jgi:DNA-binding XRE family transcriptional regulator
VAEIAVHPEAESVKQAISDLIQQLRDMRRELHMSQQELADRLELSHIAVGDWEAGRDTPMTANLFRTAHALGLLVDICDSTTGKRREETVAPARIRTTDSRIRRVLRMLREIRAERDVTQERLGSTLGVSEWTIGMWESARRTPRLPHFVAWCAALDCKLVLIKL